MGELLYWLFPHFHSSIFHTFHKCFGVLGCFSYPFRYHWNESSCGAWVDLAWASCEEMHLELESMWISYLYVYTCPEDNLAMKFQCQRNVAKCTWQLCRRRLERPLCPGINGGATDFFSHFHSSIFHTFRKRFGVLGCFFVSFPISLKWEQMLSLSWLGMGQLRRNALGAW